MLFALLAAFLFACSGVCAQRTSSMIGPVKANALRLAFATLVLGIWVLLTGGVDIHTTAARRLFVSGLVGFGLGDMALFFALPRLGARLTLLINLCTAPVFGLVGDRWLLGTRLEPFHALGCAVILIGVSQALLARKSRPAASTSRTAGFVAALIAGFGQGTGAALSRWSHQVQSGVGEMLPSNHETFLRVLAGTLAVLAFWRVVRGRRQTYPWAVERPLSPRAWLWIIANATVGAILGITCFQHALLDASSGVVLSITATTPILVMPMTAYSEHDVPSAGSIAGALVAVAGMVMLKLGA